MAYSFHVFSCSKSKTSDANCFAFNFKFASDVQDIIKRAIGKISENMKKLTHFEIKVNNIPLK